LSGQKYLKSNDISTIYGHRPYPDPELYQISSPFDLPAGVLYASLLDLLPPGRIHSSRVLGDVVEMLDHVHRFGELKRRIVSQCDRFVETRPQVGEMIRGFSSAGKKIFLLTNSGYDYAVVLLNHLFPSVGRSTNWHSLFDAVVVDADKPNYFRAASQAVAAGPGEHATIWSGGSASALESHLGVAPGRVFFVGDNPAADSAAARARGWRTALVVPELETDPYPPDVARAQDDGHDSGWGSVFWEAASPTRFARLVGDSTDIFASRVESILVRGPEAAFRAV
jgi:HAD superfamily 5'-nucleotidase-like hydrolase